MRTWLLAIVVAGCGFSIPAEEEMDPGPAPDPGDPIVPVERKCATTDPHLRLCLDFEDTPTFAEDGSGLGHHATTTMVSVMPRDSEQAVLVGDGSRVVVAEHPDLDIQGELTLTLWMRADEPEDRTQYLLDNNRQYAISFQEDGEIRCGLGSTTIDSRARFRDRAWHHVACTFDGQTLKVLVDGDVQGCRPATTISTAGAEGLAIGANVNAGPSYRDPFIGGLDNVQVFASAWTDDQLCAENGRTLCDTSCDGDDDDD